MVSNAKYFSSQCTYRTVHKYSNASVPIFRCYIQMFERQQHLHTIIHTHAQNHARPGMDTQAYLVLNYVRTSKACLPTCTQVHAERQINELKVLKTYVFEGQRQTHLRRYKDAHTTQTQWRQAYPRFCLALFLNNCYLAKKSLILDRYYFHPRVCVCVCVCLSVCESVPRLSQKVLDRF